VAVFRIWTFFCKFDIIDKPVLVLEHLGLGLGIEEKVLFTSLV